MCVCVCSVCARVCVSVCLNRLRSSESLCAVMRLRRCFDELGKLSVGTFTEQLPLGTFLLRQDGPSHVSDVMRVAGRVAVLTCQAKRSQGVWRVSGVRVSLRSFSSKLQRK